MKYALIIILTIALFFFLQAITTNKDTTIELQCRDYEENRMIPKGSCDCTIKLYKNWEESYDWMDSCKRLEAK